MSSATAVEYGHPPVRAHRSVVRYRTLIWSHQIPPILDRLVVADLFPSAVDRSARLMDQYADRPMDLADATLVALAEERGDRRIFTLDADFRIHRLRGRQRFETIPAL